LLGNCYQYSWKLNNTVDKWNELCCFISGIFQYQLVLHLRINLTPWMMKQFFI
jgi:hypothetical protein